MKDSYSDALAKAQRDLERLMEQRTEIEKQIHHLKQVIYGLSSLSGIKTDPALSALMEREALGLTGSIQQILRTGPRQEWKTAAEVRRLLLCYGVDLSKYANASAVINTVLNRLVKQGFAEKDAKHGTAKYREDTRQLEKDFRS